MNNVAFVFTSAPHGTASGREGLDALLATSALTKNIGVFFIGDGVFQLLTEQQPQTVLARDYISTFKVLPLYDVEVLWVCAASLRIRGLARNTLMMVLDINIVEPYILREKLANYNTVMNF